MKRQTSKELNEVLSLFFIPRGSGIVNKNRRNDGTIREIQRVLFTAQIRVVYANKPQNFTPSVIFVALSRNFFQRQEKTAYRNDSQLVTETSTTQTITCVNKTRQP